MTLQEAKEILKTIPKNSAEIARYKEAISVILKQAMSWGPR